MADDLSGQKVWNDIARAYERFIIRTSFYQQMMRDLAAQVGDAERVLDAGCGVGYLMNSLLEKPTRHVIGVDTNAHMLDIARNEIITPERLVRAELLQADVTQFCRPGEFDAIVSSNVLFNLRKPYDFLDNMYSSLKPGGKLVLTSAKHNPNLDRMIETGLGELRDSGRLTPELEHHANVVREVNRRFMGAVQTGEQLFHTFDNKGIEEALLRFTGFEQMTCNADTYLGQNFIVGATKPQQEEGIIFKVADSAEELDMVYGLRYHVLHDLVGFLEKNPSRQERTPYDARAVSVLAFTERTRKPVGCFTLVMDVPGDKLPEEETLAVDQNLRQQEVLASPFRWTVLPRYRNTGVGKHLFKMLYDLSNARGVSYWIFPINPDLKDYFLGKMGCIQVGPMQKYHQKTGLPLHLRLRDANQGAFA